MELDVGRLLHEDITLLLFLLTLVGFLIGKRKIDTIEIGATTGVMPVRGRSERTYSGTAFELICDK